MLEECTDTEKKVKYSIYSFDIDIDPRTFILKHKLDMINMYLSPDTKVSSYSR